MSFSFVICKHTMWNKLGHTLSWLGEKGANAASWLGQKVGGGLAAISPVVSLFNPVIGVGAASAGMVQKGIGALGDAGKALLARGDFNPQVMQRIVDGIRSDTAVVRAAYTEVRGGIGNPLERWR
jgi:hypothetical protein